MSDIPVMLSALEHYVYCPRQCALIHLEQTFDENIYTLRGQVVHENVDVPSGHELHDTRFERAMPLWSEALNLTGKADMVEFHGDVPYPVEYKSGKRRKGTSEKIQLCAQALCLEEMLGVPVPEGALYWYGSRKRVAVTFDEPLRNMTLDVIEKTRALLESGVVPSPVDDERCDNCSLRASCLPELAERTSLEKNYLALFEGEKHEADS